jgi:general secretion pathway protein A
LESLQYIEHRMELCGGSADRIFGRRTLDYIVRRSGGVPRRINALCHNSLLLAYSGGARRVSLAMARDSVAEFDGLVDVAARREPSGWLPSGIRSITPVLGLGLLGVAGFASGHALLNRHPLCNLRSAVARTNVTQAPPAKVAATIDPGIVAVSSAAGHPEPMPSRPAASPPPPSPPPPEMKIISADAAAPVRPVHKSRPFVVVVRGDTLADIALRYMGSAKQVPALMRLNPHITDASFLYPGELVYLPPQSSSTTTTADATDVE